MKTQDNKSILIELDDEGWKFTYDNYDINIDNGLYFGNKIYILKIKIFLLLVFQIARKKILNGRLKKYNEKIRSFNIFVR